MGSGWWTSQCNHESVFCIQEYEKNIEILISCFSFSFYTYERVQEIVAFIQNIVPAKPEVAIICGSGLGGLAELVVDKVAIPYADIPNFPRSTGKNIFVSIGKTLTWIALVAGHRSNLVFGVLNGISVVCMQGRFHPYEGYTTAAVNIFFSRTKG